MAATACAVPPRASAGSDDAGRSLNGRYYIISWHDLRACGAAIDDANVVVAGQENRQPWFAESASLCPQQAVSRKNLAGTVCAPGKMQERIVPILEERVSFLEGRLVEQSTTLADIRRSVEHLEERMDQRFTAVDLRFSAIDERFSAVDLRFTALDQRFTELERKIDSHFTWLVGILVTTLAALFVAVFTRT
jgi:uncharacterized coiled-coil protein SlyX